MSNSLKDVSSMVGKTVKSVRTTCVVQRRRMLEIQFTDDSNITIAFDVNDYTFAFRGKEVVATPETEMSVLAD